MTLPLIKKISFYAATLLILILGFALPVSAQQEALGFSVSPVIFDMTANRGQVWKSTIDVINANPYELRLNVRVVRFEPQNESGVPSFIELDLNDTTSLAAWMAVPETIVVPPESTLEIPVVIYVPEDADPGGHFAAVLIGNDLSQDESDQNAPQVATSQVISSLFFLSVAGDITESARIRSFRASEYFMARPEGTFELRLENEGNVHLQPTGEITIVNMWGQVRGKIPINQEAHFGKILPNSVRKYSYDWSSDWSIADIGWYRAEAVLSYGTTDRQSMTAETSFLVLPIGWVLLTVGALIAIFFLFTSIVKLYVRKTLALSGYAPIDQEAVPLTKTKRRLDFIAPLEAGLLDLRSNLEDKVNLRERFVAVVHFATTYWRFFAYLLGVLIVIVLLVLYVRSATLERPYTVISESGQVTTNETEEVDDMVPSIGQTRLPITIVDRTGQPLVATEILNQLEVEGYTITERMTEQVEDRTVIVYSQDRTREAVQLSRLFGDALLSALPADSENNQIVLFLGADQIPDDVE